MPRRVYINWLLSKEGQTAFAQASGYISSRLDVPTDHAAWPVTVPGAIKTYTIEATTTIKDKVLAVLKEAFGKWRIAVKILLHHLAKMHRSS